jgi:hypothetical protein
VVVGSEALLSILIMELAMVKHFKVATVEPVATKMLTLKLFLEVILLLLAVVELLELIVAQTQLLEMQQLVLV